MKQVALWGVLLPLFVIPFIPLFVSGSFFFPFITSKAFAFRILVELAVVAWVVLAFLDKNYRPKFSWPLVLYGALVVWMAIADIVAVNPHKAFWSNFERMDGWVTLVHVFGFFLVAGSVLAEKKLWRPWWLTFIGASLLIVITGLFQIWGITPINQGGVRVDATFGNASYLAAYLLFAAAVTAWQALESKGWLRYTLLALIPLQAIIIFATATRGAMLGFGVGLALAAVLYLFEKNATRAKKIAISSLVTLAIIVGGFLAIRDTEFVRNDPTLSRIASISLDSLTTRFTIWEMAFQGFQERPILGWGHEGFNYVFNIYYEPSMYGQEPWFDRAHNTFLDWLIAGGAPALLLFLALLLSVALILYRKETTSAERVFLLAGLAAYACQGLVVFDNLFTYVPLAAILAIAHAASCRPIRILEQYGEVKEHNAALVLAPAVVGFVILLYVVNIPNISASGSLIAGLQATQMGQAEVARSQFKRAIDTGTFGTQEVREQAVVALPQLLTRTDIPDSQKQAFYEFVMTEMSKEVERVPKDARLRLQYATGFQAAGDHRNALAQIMEAEALSPKKQQAITQRGLVLWQAGDRTAAAEAFFEAYALDTYFQGLAVYAAAGAFLVGDAERGTAILQEHFGTTVVDNQILIYAYYDAQRFDDIVAIYRKRIEESGSSADVRFEFVRVLATMGRLNEAVEEIQNTVRDNPERKSEGEELLRALLGSTK
jgi:O-antigen ligase